MLIKRLLYCFFILLLLLPLLLGKFGLDYEKPLMGDFYSKSDTVFTIQGWFNGRYHIKKEDFIDENFGFRNFFVRTNNQVLFTLFNTSKANKVIVGKNNYLFGEDYISSYLGKDFIGEEKIKKTVEELTEINEQFKKKGKTLVIIITPNKCYYYPEYLPNKFTKINAKTNYEVYLNYLSKSNILFIDFNSWIVNQKNKSQYVMYPKTGIHWANYAAALAADSVVKFLNQKTSTGSPGFIIDGVELDDKARNPDQDIEDASNLLFPISKPKLAYPIIKPSLNGKMKPRTLIISDSYYWNWSWYGLDTLMFENPKMGYYYSDLYNIKAGRDVHKPLIETGIGVLLAENDLFILMTTEGKLESFPWGFIEGVHSGLNVKIDVKKKKRFTEEVMIKIKQDSTWRTSVKQKAIVKNISLDSMIVLDAELVVNENYLKILIEDYVKEIKSNTQWLKSIEEKAKIKNISLEEMIRIDAVFMAEEEVKR